MKKGDVELHISKISQESRILVEEGDITIKMIDTHPVKITIDATEIYPGKVVKKHKKRRYSLDPLDGATMSEI